MKLTEDSADIPENLIAEQERGGVVFLCGAGVSKSVGLPLFDELTRNIYRRLGESWKGYPAEANAMEPEPGRAVALDRALFALAKRLRGTDAASRVRAESLITSAVEEELAVPPRVNLVVHRNIIKLSRGPEMQSRIVTTNFDTLFERAWPDEPVVSRAGPDLPAPLTSDFAGVLHLHGRIEDSELKGIHRTSLVLDSADFGDAYLRSGWAARYVYDLSRAATVVIVGYAADDPPMRYILEVLTADRERYPDLKQIFAFAPCAPDSDAREQATAVWEAKGASAVLYDSSHPADHRALYSTLAAWSDYADEPGKWRRRHARRIFAVAPELVCESDWERLRWVLSRRDAEALLADVNPIPRWAKQVSRVGLFAGGQASLASWVLRRIADSGMPSALTNEVPLDHTMIANIECGLARRLPHQTPLPDALVKAWRLILEDVESRRAGWPIDLDQAMRLLSQGDLSLRVRRAIVSGLRPRAEPSPPWGRPLPKRDPAAELRLRDVIHVKFGPSQVSGLDELAVKLPVNRRCKMITSLLSALDDSLEDAVEYEFVSQGWDGASFGVKSVAVHHQNRISDGFYPIVRAIIDVWERVANENQAKARALANPWRDSDFLLHQRMWVHTLSTVAYTATDFAEAVLSISDRVFWEDQARPEVMRLLTKRWSELVGEARLSVERRIAAGPRGQLFLTAEEDQKQAYVDHEVFRRLERIKSSGHELGPTGTEVLRAIRLRHPEWVASAGDRDDFGTWISDVMSYGPQGDINLLADVSPNELVSQAFEIARRNPRQQDDLWRLFCSADPLHALEALLVGLKADRNEHEAWRSFFGAAAENEDSKVQEAVANAVVRAELPRGLAGSILDWLKRRRTLIPMTEDALLTLWDSLFMELEDDGLPVTDNMRDDALGHVLNSAEGKAGWILLEELGRSVRSSSTSPFSESLRRRIERLVKANGALGLIGRATMMLEIPTMNYFDAAWTENLLAQCLSWVNPVSAAACWAMILLGGPPTPNLYRVIKEDMFAACRRPAVSRNRQNIADWLLRPLLSNQEVNGDNYDVDAPEVRRALVKGDDALRESSAFWFAQTLTHWDGDRANFWRERLGAVFASTWPAEPMLRAAGSSAHLLRLTFLSKAAFADAVDKVAPTLAPMVPWKVATSLKFDGDGIHYIHYYDKHPAAMLRLIEAVVDAKAPPPELADMLYGLTAADPEITKQASYRKLLGWSRTAEA